MRMVTSLLPRTFKPLGTGREERGARFGEPLETPRVFKGAGHGGSEEIPLEVLRAQVTNNQGFEGFEPAHETAEALEADLAQAGVAVSHEGPVGASAYDSLRPPPRRRGV